MLTVTCNDQPCEDLRMPATRVLHVVLNRLEVSSGVSHSLVSLFRAMDRDRYVFDFLVPPGKREHFDPIVEELGGRVIHQPTAFDPRHPVQLAGGLVRTIRGTGAPIVHSHANFRSGYVLACARLAGCRGRIAHSQTDSGALETAPALRARRLVQRAAVRATSNARIGCADGAARWLFGPRWAAHAQIVFPGIDDAELDIPDRRAATRAELATHGIPVDAVVVLCIARLDLEQKNQLVLVDAVGELVARGRRDVHVVLVGNGLDEATIRAHVADRDLGDHVHLLGARSDVSELLQAADVAALPSQYEGLPLIAMQAQGAGIPSVFSTAVEDDGVFAHSIVQRLPATAGATAWADALLAAAATERLPLSRSLPALRASGLTHSSQAEALTQVYDRLLTSTTRTPARTRRRVDALHLIPGL
jgi:glycosyltransferase EpsF